MKWEDKLFAGKAYVPGEQIGRPGLIKLNTNENPYPPSPAVADFLHNFDPNTLNLYPDPDATNVKAALSKVYDLPEDMIFVSNGSDEALAFAFRAFFNSELPVLFPDITYSFYPVWCAHYGIPYREVALDEDFMMRAEDFAMPNGGVVIANPNAPTGIAQGADFIAELLNECRDSVVIADEAYVDFGAESALPLLKKYENLCITGTLSKSASLASLRIGFAFAGPKLIAALNTVKNSFNSYTVNRLSAQLAVAALGDMDSMRANAKKIVATRNDCAMKLRAMGFELTDSKANFLFASHRIIDAEALYGYLKSNDILVRHFGAPRIRDYLRISVGLPEEMDKLLERIAAFIGSEAQNAV